jgi:hypothetical protein
LSNFGSRIAYDRDNPACLSVCVNECALFNVEHGTRANLPDQHAEVSYTQKNTKDTENGGSQPGVMTKYLFHLSLHGRPQKKSEQKETKKI